MEFPIAVLSQVVFLVLASVASGAAANTAELSDLMAKGITNCQQRFPIPSDQLQSFMETKLLKDDTNEAATCFVQCVLEGLGVVSNGVALVESMQKMTEDYFRGRMKPDGSMVNVDLLKKNVEDCARSETGNITCQKNYRIWRCTQMK
ncbi:hypothetical protein J437_LFUL005268, partial [Ladona fulva]